MIWMRVTATVYEEMERTQHGPPFVHLLFSLSLVFVTAGSRGTTLTMTPLTVQVSVAVSLSSVLQQL